LIIEHNGQVSPDNYKKYLPLSYLIIYLFKYLFRPINNF